MQETNQVWKRRKTGGDKRDSGARRRIRMPKRVASGSGKAASKGSDPSTAVVELLAYDILVGRGFQYEGNPGNALFQETIESSMSEYNAAPTRRGKTEVVNRIFQDLSASSRFLKHDASSGYYYIVSKKEAKQKISHALRYRIQSGVDDEEESDAKEAASSQDSRNFSRPAQHALQTSEASAQLSTGDAVAGQNRDAAEMDSKKRQKINNDDDSSIFSAGQLESVLGRPEEYVDAFQQGEAQQSVRFRDERSETVQTSDTPEFPQTMVNHARNHLPDGLNEEARALVSHRLPLHHSESMRIFGQEATTVRPAELGVDALSSLEGDSPPPRKDTAMMESED